MRRTLSQSYHASTRIPATLGRPLSPKEELAQQLACFLLGNDVEDYVSPEGYRFKRITKRQAKEEAA